MSELQSCVLVEQEGKVDWRRESKFESAISERDDILIALLYLLLEALRFKVHSSRLATDPIPI